MEYGEFNDISDKVMEEQAVNAHFFVQQTCACLVIIGCGLFKFRAVARLLMKSVDMKDWTVDLRPNDPNATIEKNDSLQTHFGDWMTARANSKWIRRSLEDMYNSLIYPKEAHIFVYRGMGWIKNGLGVRWEDLTKHLGLPPKEVKQFTRMLNDPIIAVRHGTKSGRKMRASATDLAGAANILDIVNGIRAEKEPEYRPFTPEEMVKRSLAVPRLWCTTRGKTQTEDSLWTRRPSPPRGGRQRSKSVLHVSRRRSVGRTL